MLHPGPRASRPRVKRRAQIALAIAAIGATAGVASWFAFPLTHGADFAQFHFHARNWLAGRDPYVGGFPIMRRTRVVPEPFFYPFPSLFVLAPFALIPLRAAMALFVGCSTALLAWGILAKSPERLPMLLGAGFIVASGLGQWTPLVTATLLIPALGFLAVVKPNVGLASVADDPSAIRILGGGALLLISLAFQPNWPAEWLAQSALDAAAPVADSFARRFSRAARARAMAAARGAPARRDGVRAAAHVLRRPAPALARRENSARIDSAQRDEPRRVGDLAASAQPPRRHARIRVRCPRSSRSLRAGARHGAQTAQRGHDSIVSRTTHRKLAEVDQRWTVDRWTGGPVEDR